MATLYNPADQLTPRQQDIVRLSYTGYSLDEIGEELRISLNTLRWHTTQIRRVYPHFRCGWAQYQVKLTPAEETIMQLVASGLGNRAISQRMNLAVRTVQSYLTRLYRKTRTKNRVDLARTGLVVGNRVLLGESEATYT